MTLCVICSTTVRRGITSSISCITCNNIFHINCIPLTQSEADHLKTIKKNWSCKNCSNKGTMSDNSILSFPVLSSTDSNSVDLILKKIEALTFGQSTLIDLVNKQNDKLTSFEQKLTELCTQINIIKVENNTLRTQLFALTQRVISLETRNSNISED